MKPSFVAGFGPIVRDVEGSRAFWAQGLGIAWSMYYDVRVEQVQSALV